VVQLKLDKFFRKADRQQVADTGIASAATSDPLFP